MHHDEIIGECLKEFEGDVCLGKVVSGCDEDSDGGHREDPYCLKCNGHLFGLMPEWKFRRFEDGPDSEGEEVDPVQPERETVQPEQDGS